MALDGRHGNGALGLPSPVLETHGAVHQDDLAATFAATYLFDAARGYGYGMHELLPKLAERPSSWRVHRRGLLDGQGSLGNGAAMRVAPLGAWFCDDLEEVAEQAAFSADGHGPAGARRPP
ncbi:ADP-ribosylglycohydrolase family protein [Streptomyces sp. NPDC047082]|uniref:ADP-ribosylglycohydrolase family protein n=1 Tax=Streptomyces sp. NPDC047082 TaxID=3155259 RepID=UPI003408876D